jgi:hypothetical protein
MTEKKKGPEKMMDFIINRMNSEDLVTAALIQPLPDTVRPSSQFLASTRAQLLSVADESRESRAA